MGRAQPSPHELRPRVRQVGFSTFLTMVHLNLKAVGTNGEKAGQHFTFIPSLGQLQVCDFICASVKPNPVYS